MGAAVYLVTGDPFLADEAVDRIRAEEGTDALSEIHLDGSSTATEIVEAASTSSLFSDRRLVVVERAEDLDKASAEAIGRYLEAPSPDSALVFVASGKTKIDALVKSSGTVIALDPPKGRSLAAWLKQRAADHKLKLDDRAAYALINTVGNGLRELDGALEQLSTGHGTGAKITADAVRKAFFRQADERTFAFTDAVGERKLAPAVIALRRLLDQGDEPLALFGVLTAHFRRLLRARRYADAGPREVASALGMPEWRAKKMIAQIRSYREEELVDALQMLAATDLDMKGEFPSPEAALERTVMKIITATP